MKGTTAKMRKKKRRKRKITTMPKHNIQYLLHYINLAKELFKKLLTYSRKNGKNEIMVNIKESVYIPIHWSHELKVSNLVL